MLPDTINGAPVTRRGPNLHYRTVEELRAATRGGDTIFIPLPRVAWTSAGPCSCIICGGAEGFWDTVAVRSTPPKPGESDTAWTVHYPELHRP